MKSKIMTPGRSEAEELAVQMLVWIAGQEEMMGRFLAMSGLTATGLRAASTDPGFLSGLMDFIMAHEPTLMAFATESGHAPEYLAACHQALSGGDPNPWM